MPALESAIVLSRGGSDDSPDRRTELVAVLHEPADFTEAYEPGPPPIGILFVPGAPQYRAGAHRMFVTMARALAQAGWPCLRFDRSGFGDNDAPEAGFVDASADIQTALDAFYRAYPELIGVVLLGLCDGASASMLNAASDSRFRGLVLINPWIRTDAGRARAIAGGYYPKRAASLRNWLALLKKPKGLLNATRGLGSALRDVSRTSSSNAELDLKILEQWSLFDGKSLVVLSDNDLTAHEFGRGLKRSKAWHSAHRRKQIQVSRIRDADHTFSDHATLHQLVDMIEQWMSRAMTTR